MNYKQRTDAEWSAYWQQRCKKAENKDRSILLISCFNNANNWIKERIAEFYSIEKWNEKTLNQRQKRINELIQSEIKNQIKLYEWLSKEVDIDIIWDRIQKAIYDVSLEVNMEMEEDPEYQKIMNEELIDKREFYYK